MIQITILIKIRNVSHLGFRFLTGVRGGLVVSVLDCQSRGSGFKLWPGWKFCLRFLLHLRNLVTSATCILSTLTLQYHWDGETRGRGLATSCHMLRLGK